MDLFEAIASKVFSRMKTYHPRAYYCVDSLDMPYLVHRLNSIKSWYEMANIMSHLASNNTEQQLILLADELYFAIKDYDTYAGIYSLIHLYIAVHYDGMAINEDINNVNQPERKENVQRYETGTGLLHYGGCRSALAQKMHKRNSKQSDRTTVAGTRRCAKTDYDRPDGRGTWFKPHQS